jgi:cytochrome P450
MLAYTLRFVAHDDTAQYRLRDEIGGSNSAQTASPQSASSLGELRYLGAIINESFRLRPNGTPLPRVTPHGRTVRLGRFDKIPGGVRVNTFQWFLHRDPRIWPAVDEWIPDRWLSPDNHSVGTEREAGRVLWPFCSGPRMCVGNHLTDYRTFRCPSPNPIFSCTPIHSGANICGQ